ncbi:hypothetical protein XELAEV_18041458mg, partial [Xenopus laevis]
DTFLDYKEKTENNRVPIVVTYNPQLGLPPFLKNVTGRCETCKYILCKDQVVIPNTQKVYTSLDYYSCASSNVVYMITCTKCSTGGIYIGETGQKLRTRMNHHRHKINTKSCKTLVGQHFCSQNHSLQDT